MRHLSAHSVPAGATSAAAVRLQVRAGRIVLALAVVILLLHVVGAVLLPLNTEAESPLAGHVSDLFALGGDGLIATWFAAGTLALGALLGAAVAIGAFQRRLSFRFHWAGLTALLALASLSTFADVGAPVWRVLERLSDAPELLTAGRIGAVVMLIVIAAVVFAPPAVALPKRLRRQFICAGVLCGCGALITQISATALRSGADGQAFAADITAGGGRLLTMSGAALLVYMLLGYLRQMHRTVRLSWRDESTTSADRDTQLLLTIRPRHVAVALALVIGALVLGHIAVMIARHGMDHKNLLGMVKMLDVNTEHNLPTWYSVLALLAAAGLLGLIGSARRRIAGGMWTSWLGLAGLFVFMSIDEATSLHEALNEPMAALTPLAHVHFPWIFAAGVLVLIVGVLYLRFLFTLPRRTRGLFIASAGLLVGGALLMEVVEEFVATIEQGIDNGPMAVLCGIEESMEMAGIALFIYALLDYLQRQVGPLDIQVIDRRGAIADAAPQLAPAANLLTPPANLPEPQAQPLAFHRTLR